MHILCAKSTKTCEVFTMIWIILLFVGSFENCWIRIFRRFTLPHLNYCIQYHFNVNKCWRSWKKIITFWKKIKNQQIKMFWNMTPAKIMSMTCSMSFSQTISKLQGENFPMSTSPELTFYMPGQLIPIFHLSNGQEHLTVS